MPGNFNMKSAEIENIDAGDLFELCVDFLDGKGYIMSIFRSYRQLALGNTNKYCEADYSRGKIVVTHK